MSPCPNCGAPVPPGARLCPDCGQEMPTVWPPPPGFVVPPGAYPSHPSGGEVALGVVLGLLFFPVFVPLIAWMLGSIPSLRDSPALGYVEVVAVVGLALGLYFGTRRRFRAFARAFGWAALGEVAVVLGALALCYALFRGI